MQKIVQFIATPEEKLNVLYICLCNGMGYFSSYGLRFDINAQGYKAAKKTAKAEDGGEVCYEDVLMEMIKTGGSINIVDDENDGESVGTINRSTLSENWDKIPQRFMEAVDSENYDANDCDCILQVIAFGEIVYG